ncbi:uroporphyrinogen-III synthase [Deinococcus petrolearius]|uniref:Uroporphyrinogen-III synthase n=1 Tax=Deinococcus petrolearius TaxID=1751295 RepID=A0ABW1DFC9_9DEIO
MEWFEGLQVLSLESRRTEEMSRLIRAHGGQATLAPSMREQKLDLGSVLAGFGRDLAAGDVHAVVCPGAAATRLFLRELGTHGQAASEVLGGVPLLAGRAAHGVLEEAGLRARPLGQGTLGTDWAEVQAALLRTLEPGQHATLLEYGEAAPALMLRELSYAGVRVSSLPLYRCAFPADSAPLAQAVRDCVLGGPDVLLLSSGIQALHFLKYAERMKLLAETRAALARMVVVSIGPACSEAAADLGIPVHLEASPYKMDALVRVAAAQAPALLRGRLRKTA